MKILFVHNHYQLRSGEAFVYELDREAAKLAGHDVLEYTRDNAELADYGPLQKLSVAARTIWAWDTQRELKALLQRERPDVAHFVNTLPLISPAAFSTCHERGVAVVWNVQNYRLICPAATLLRNGEICTECSDHGLARSVRYGCYKGSRAATLAVASTTAVHRALGTFAHAVDRYLVPSEFMAQTLIERAGIEPNKVRVKPNSVDPDPGARSETGRYLLFAGRLTPEKGILTLLDAYASLESRVPLRVVGDGPLRVELRRRVEAGSLRNVELIGPLPHDQVMTQIRGALAMIVPSEWYEGVPLSLLEAFACAVPVVAAGIGSLREVLVANDNGLSFAPGDPRDLARVLRYVCDRGEALGDIGRAGRASYLAKHTLAANANALDAIYREVARGAGAR